MKKALCLILVLVILNSVALINVSASDCNHRGGMWRVSAKAPTCTEDGNIEYKICKANECILDLNNQVIDISQVTIPALGHTEETLAGYEATCTSDGLTDGKKCSVCGEITAAQEVIPSNGHIVVTETKIIENATCAADGEELIITFCDVCKETLKEETVTVPATGEHKHTEEVEGSKVKPTCTTQGSVEMRCACGDIITVTVDIDENAHNWSNWTVTKEPTCVLEGEECRVCANDASHIEKRTLPIKADAHNWSNWTVTKEPTCVLEGEECRVCENNASHTEKRTIPVKADAHTLDSRIENENSASCGADGSYTIVVYCITCLKVTDRQLVPVPATGNHNYTDEIDGTKIEPTCVKDGSVQMRCICGAVKTVSIPLDKNNHKWNKNGKVTLDATCVYEGEIVYDCINDGCTAERKEAVSVDANAHKWDNGTVSKNATCSSEGEIEYCCAYSPLHKRTEKIPKDRNVHNLLTETRNFIDATCGKNGSYDSVTFCVDCKTVLKTLVNTIPATGEHNYNAELPETKVPPTCISDGSVTFKCQCGATRIEKLPMDATAHIPDSEGYNCILCGKELRCRHNWTAEKVITKESSCIENGSKAIICTKCNEPKTGSVEVIPAFGHSFTDDWKTVTNPSCSSPGVKIRICRNCFDFVTEAIPKLSHADKNKDYICDNCNTVTDMSAFTENNAKPDGGNNDITDNNIENNTVKNCNCDCHKTGFTKLIFSIVNFFEKLFGSNKVCKCGVKH